MKREPKKIIKEMKEVRERRQLHEAVARVHASDQAHLPELEKAGERILAWPDHNGQLDLKKPSAATMRWTIALASRDLDTMSGGDFQNLQYELAYFSFRGPILAINGFHTYIPSKAIVQTVQQWLRESLQVIVDTPTSKHRPLKCVAYSFTGIMRALHWVHNSDQNDGRWEMGWSTTADDNDLEQSRVERLIGYFLDLLKDHADNLRRCPCEDCGKIFFRNRINASCCSNVCTSRHAKRKELGILPERFGKRGRPPGTIATKGRINGEKKTQKVAATSRAHPRRLSAKRP